MKKKVSIVIALVVSFVQLLNAKTNKTDELKNELVDKLFEDASWIKEINYFELEEALLEEDRYSEDFRGFIYFMRHVTNTLMIK